MAEKTSEIFDLLVNSSVVEHAKWLHIVLMSYDEQNSL